MKNYFLGVAANYTKEELFHHTFGIGREKDIKLLEQYLGKRYGGEAILCKNGRSALALTLKAYFDPGDVIIVNGFTCYAVYEAVKVAGLVPLFADIEKESLNFSIKTLEKAEKRSSNSEGEKKKVEWSKVKGIIIQNTLGIPVDILQIESFARKHNLTIIEDLAHCAGMKYLDGREAGTVGAGTICSFGKDKSIDTISGGAAILRAPVKHQIKRPTARPRFADSFRARFYPLFGAIYRGLSHVKLSGVFMGCLLKLKMVEKSADNKLDVKRRINRIQAKRALIQFKKLKKGGKSPIRKFYLVRDRDQVLSQLTKRGYYFGGIWYDKPVSPERYYKKVHFPEQDCPNAVYVAKHIVNLPTYYTDKELAEARNIIKNNLEEGIDG